MTNIQTRTRNYSSAQTIWYLTKVTKSRHTPGVKPSGLLKKPTILFSATPYRNDYKVFNIDKEKFYSLEHTYCEKKYILRSLEIIAINPQQPGPAGFVNELLSFV
ncbi:MAG: hypothetical protein M3N14_12250 [Bacteroidota bacterium]|nr:hypothetical protein [Bacteroidota bacterium]